jgi:hypothetical protein
MTSEQVLLPRALTILLIALLATDKESLTKGLPWSGQPSKLFTR